MKKLFLNCYLWLAVMLVSTAQAQTTYDLYMRISDRSGVITGPVSSIPGITGGNFFQLGCTEHQFEIVLSSGPGPVNSLPAHSPYLVTRTFDPTTSPMLRLGLNTREMYDVEIYFVTDNGSTQATEFSVELNNALITKITTAADMNALQETFSFAYDTIRWTDVVNGRSFGYDLINNVAL